MPIIRPVLFAIAVAGFTPSCPAAVSGYDALFGGKSRAVAKTDPGAVTAFYQQADALAAEVTGLTANDAAARWLTLADAFAKVPREQWWRDNSRPYDKRGFSALIAVLPPVASWDAVIAGIHTRNDKGDAAGIALRTLAVALGDESGRDAAVAGVRAAITAREKRFRDNPGSADQLRQTLVALLRPGSPEAIAAARESWEKRLASLDLKQNRMNGRIWLGEIPDLLKLYDETRVRADLTRLCLANASFNGLNSPKLLSLLTDIVAKNINQLPGPVWEAVTLDSDPAVYEALDKKFPAKAGEDTRYERQNARKRHLLTLLKSGRTDDAVAIAVKTFRDTGDVPTPGDWSSSKKLPARLLADYYAGILRADPAAPVLSPYRHAAAAAGRSADYLKAVREIAARNDLPADARLALEEHETAALLADDKPDEAIPRLLAAAKAPRPKKPENGDTAEARAEERTYRLAAGRIDEARARLLMLGQVLGRPDLTDAGIAAFDAKNDADQNVWETQRLFEALFQARRYDDLEKRSARLLSGTSGDDSDYGRRQSHRLALTTLVRVYHAVGRDADVVAVLEKNPDWAADDLRGIDVGDNRFVSDIAESLLKLGRNDDARRVADFAVAEKPRNDAGYAALLETTKAGADFLKRMDAQFAKDRFEERPLIWKAKALYDLGRYDEALETAKAAVTIDPSDGEQGKGDRMRIYAVLADILDKKGDAETARIYRGAVAAIRMGEDADDIYAAGLLKRALAQWEESLTKFADAYCVQSRLALRYSEAGDMEKAERHYTRAFELMPDSFGRIESHCFGCEGAFEGEMAQGVAERVFTWVIAKNPANSRAHYLIGYLREAQGRPADAAEAYRKAVALDPDYYNAWSKLRSLAESAALQQDEIVRCARAMFRLDPAGRHGRADLDAIGDLRYIVTTLASVGIDANADDSPVFPLPAAKARLDKKRGAANAFDHMRYSRNEERSRATIIMQNKLVQLACNIANNDY